MHRLNWDDLQYVLAVADAQSVAGAARELGVNHATVLRRIAAFEESVGTQVFDRTPRGYALRPDRLRLIAAAREVGQAVTSVCNLADGLDAPLGGHARVTSTDTLCQTVLPEILAELCGKRSELQLSLISTNSHLNLSRLEAELTVRPAKILPEGLVGESPVSMHFAAYALPGCANLGWLGFDGSMRRSTAWAWLEPQLDKGRVVASGDSFLVLRELVARGVGKALLPVFVGRKDLRLEQIDIDLPGNLATPIWVACHEDLADVPRLIRIRKLLCEALEARATDFVA